MLVSYSIKLDFSSWYPRRRNGKALEPVANNNNCSQTRLPLSRHRHHLGARRAASTLTGRRRRGRLDRAINFATPTAIQLGTIREQCEFFTSLPRSMRKIRIIP